jgi:hypothetical protein
VCHKECKLQINLFERNIIMISVAEHSKAWV